MKVIYEPGDKAAEYAPLAARLYEGCAHGCTYCYMPPILLHYQKIKTHAQFHEHPRPRPGVIEAMREDAAHLARCGDRRPILLCFNTDPYQKIDGGYGLTRQALEVLGGAGLRVRILTKGPFIPRRDFDLMTQYGVELGVTLVSTDQAFRRAYEPNTEGLLGDRARLLRDAKQHGIRTWISIEPVIAPMAALNVILKAAQFADYVRVGKINHSPQQEAAVDWPHFLRQALDLLDRVRAKHGTLYSIKQSLWQFADDAIKARWPRQCEGIDDPALQETTT